MDALRQEIEKRSSAEGFSAMRIVRLAAPYAPFSADIMKDTDILSITRTWTFTRTDELHTQ